MLALSSIAVYGIMLAGWASGSKYPLLGSVRASAQMISYEAALGLSLAAVLLAAGTLSTAGIVIGQDTLSRWNLVATGIVPFIVFLIAATAELNRPPFDLVEAEQELVGGFHTEYSAFGFALFFLAEFMNTITMSAVIVTLFLGGPQPIALGDTTIDIPLIPNSWEGTVWFLLKLLVFLYAYVWFRGTLPRLRYDQLIDLGWKVMVPTALGWLLLLAAIRVGRTTTGTRSSSWRSRSSRSSPSTRSSPRALRVSGRTASEKEPRLMGYLEGFGVTIRQHRLFGGKRVTKGYSAGGREEARRQEPAAAEAPGCWSLPDVDNDEKAAKPAALSRPPRPQPLRGRQEKCIGSNCAPACARRRASTCAAPTTTPRTRPAGRAVRLRLRDH